ncbi:MULTISPECIES: DUF4402 domain-containing protein [unclassified Shewanella]|uniref:DUF4402 domain-containing protein n=1 Tax=unclassified Shewanella TaxID=196818 RepID=UPI00354CBF32
MSLFMLATAIAQANFTLVAPVAIEQTQELNLGNITNQMSVYCQLDQHQRQGNGCIASDNQLGQFMLTGNEQSNVEVIVYANSGDDILFTPILPNGSQQQTFQLTQQSTMIEVGGKVDVLHEQASGHQTLSYTVEVNYQ